MRDHPPRCVSPSAAWAGAIACLLLVTFASPWSGAQASAAEPTPTATPDPEPGFCRVTGRQSAVDDVAERGRPATLALSLAAECPEEARGRSDIMLVVDHSSSMGDGGKYEASSAAVRLFVENVDFARHRVGLVLFNDRSWVAQPLTERSDRILSAFTGSGAPIGGTDIALALSSAEEELELRGRPEAVPIIVLMTDGQSAVSSMLAAAQRSRERGTVLFAIGLGADAAQSALREVATSPDHYYFAPGPDLLGEIYQRIADMIRTFSVTNVTVYDALASGVAFVPGSGRPDDPATDGRLAWRRGFLLPEPTTLEYDVRIQRLGDVQPSAEVWVEFTDGDGILRRAAIEPARLTVVEPEVHTAFLPLVTRRACHPVRDNVDVVLAVDVSSSMAGEKLEQAVDAAKAFVGLLDTPAVQAAVVRYDETASLSQPLTGDKAALLRALDGLSTGQGTRLDRGIEAAVTELVGPRHRLDAGSAIVLLSDGRQVEEVDRARAWAEVAWSRQVAVFTIALGQDADRDLLRDLADVPGHAYTAPDLAGLRAIYAQLAGAIRCR